MKIHALPVLKDNYSYLIEDEPSRTCLIVDPPDADAVISYMEQEGLRPVEVWVTHHHSDHTAGIPALKQHFPQLRIVCSSRDGKRIPEADKYVKEGDRLEFAGEEAEILELPGHAEGHIAYHFPESAHLFSGDVIFGASCGAVFGDTYTEMYRSVTRVSKLSPQTRLWVGHEYTANNLKFASTVLGEDALAERKASFKVPSVPLLLAEELKTNPFMRLSSPEVLSYLELSEDDPEVTFKALRLAKNSF